MLASDFKKCFFSFFKPLDYLIGNFFYLLTGVFTANGTFPDEANPPALLLIIFEVFSVPFFVAGKLLFPEFLIGFWKNKVLTVFMGVPEAAVYKDYCVVMWKYEVWFTRVTLVTDSVAETGFEKGRANLFFGLCILCTDMRHVFMAVFRRKSIHILKYLLTSIIRV